MEKDALKTPCLFCSPINFSVTRAVSGNGDNNIDVRAPYVH